jgi:membrane-associated phospholipid phosphatase
MTAGGYAFPSGHTTAATLGAGLLAWALARHLRAAPARVAVWAAAVGYAGLVGWSRIWLGVHWPLDVLGGWLLATGWLAGMAAAVLAVRRALPGLFDTDRRAAATTTTPTTTATDPTGRG